MIKVSAAFASTIGAALLWWFYYHHHHKWRDCFDESGRCFDPDTLVVYHEQSGIVWLILALITTCLALFAWRKALQKR